MVSFENLSLPYVNYVNRIVSDLCIENGELWVGWGDLPLTHKEMFGCSLARHWRLGSKHKHASSHDGRVFCGCL